MNDGIRNYEYALRGKADFVPLSRELPGRLGFSELEGITERRGNFLIVELKEETLRVPRGQAILFEALLRGLKNLSAVMVISVRHHEEAITDPDAHYIAVQLWMLDSKTGEIRKISPSTKQLPSQIVGDWFRLVESHHGSAHSTDLR